MKVRDLIKELQQVDQDLEVVVSADGEGNYYSPVADISKSHYQAENTWSGQCFHPSDIEEMMDEGEDLSDIQQVIVIWPTN